MWVHSGAPLCLRKSPKLRDAYLCQGKDFGGGERRDVLGAERERGGGSCATGRISSSGRDEQHVGLNKEWGAHPQGGEQ